MGQVSRRRNDVSAIRRRIQFANGRFRSDGCPRVAYECADHGDEGGRGLQQESSRYSDSRSDDGRHRQPGAVSADQFRLLFPREAGGMQRGRDARLLQEDRL